MVKTCVSRKSRRVFSSSLKRAGYSCATFSASFFTSSGFAIALPDDVEKEEEKVGQASTARFKEEEKTRRDFRDTQVFTIDPDDAKDYDDALSFKKLSGDLFEVGIHIADVSFFVTEGSLIDKEAIKRGTSIYLVDRTIPMLPEILSNDLASLVPNQDRLVFSAVFTMNKNGDVKERWFGRGIIRSAMRFTYATAQEALRQAQDKLLDTKKGEFSTALLTLDAIALKLREKRAKEGAFTFGQEEVKFELNAEGKPIRVYKKERLETNKLIEDFMVLANAEVAMFASGKDRAIEQTFIYRVHDI